MKADLARRIGPRRWLTRLCIVAAVIAVLFQWVNNRVAILRANQNLANPMVLATYPFYHSMATGMREGRIGQVDLLAVRNYTSLNNLSAPFERSPKNAEQEWVNFYTLDVGYSFIVEAARLAFPSLPDNHLRALAMQIAVDAALVGVVYFMFSQWSVALGLLAAFLYASNGVFYDLVSFAYYYFWDIPLTFIVLGALLLAIRRPAQATAWMALGGLALGFGVWLRGSWWPLSLFLCLVAASQRSLRRKLVVAVVLFAVLAVPAVVRASRARGQLTFTTRAVWHVALVGLGYYPNPYGLAVNDGTIFELTRQKYGVRFRSEDYFEHDQAAKKEFFDIWRKDRTFVLRSFAGRLKESVLGATQTSVLSFLFVNNATYRLLCLLGFVAMIIRGGDRRLLAIAAAGMYWIYVLLTCAFYFVGLAYDNVSEVALFVLFVGGIDALLHATGRAVSEPTFRRSSLPAAGVQVPTSG